jgi:hypothetical protein
LVACGALLATLLASPARAYDFEVSSRTEGQGYQLRRFVRDGIQFLNRRRVTQYLGLRVFNLLDDGQLPFRPGTRRTPALLTFQAQLRFDTDFGGYMSPDQAVPELQNNALDLMQAALQGRGLLRGWLDFTLGRQLEMEAMDFFAFDGLRLRLTSPWHVYLEAHGGTQVLGAHPFSSTVFEPDGVSGDTSQDVWAPTFGVAVGTDDLSWLHLRLAYRGVASRAPRVSGKLDSEPLWGIDEELIYFGGGLSWPRLGLRAMLGLRHNLLTGETDDLQVTGIVPIGARLSAQLEYLRARPHFDGDSIFNVFAVQPYSEVSARASYRVLDPLALLVRGGYRWLWSDASEGDLAERGALTVGVGASWRGERLRANVEGYYLGNSRGATFGGDVDGAWTVWRPLTVEGRLSLLRAIDENQSQTGDRDVINFGFQAGARWRLVSGVQLLLLFEDNVSRLYRSALRLLAVLDLELAP